MLFGPEEDEARPTEPPRVERLRYLVAVTLILLALVLLLGSLWPIAHYIWLL